MYSSGREFWSVLGCLVYAFFSRFFLFSHFSHFSLLFYFVSFQSVLVRDPIRTPTLQACIGSLYTDNSFVGSFRLSLCTKSVVEILLSFLSLLFCFFSCAAEFSIRISSKVLGGEKNRKIEARKKRDTRHQCRTATEADRREETDGRWARQGRESFKGGFG